MKKIICFMITLIMILSLSACGKRNSQKLVSDELGIDASEGKELSAEDTHGGFNGDGYTFISLEFKDKSMEKELENISSWKSFPLDKVTETLVYGKDENEKQEGPYLTDDGGSLLIPKIDNGYYLLIDRHTEKEKTILERYSFNFTLGIYDSDNDILYFCKMDT